MLRIGEFSRLSRVSVKMLRYYDELDLFKPAQVDAFTGYRYYSIDQLPQLSHILTLKELGFSLEQIARLLEEHLSPVHLRGMLRLKQSELRRRVEEEQARLARVEERLRQIEQEGIMPNDEYSPDVIWPVVKALYYKADKRGIIDLLAKYLEHAPNLDEEFRARHEIVDNYALLYKYEEAVKWHAAMMAQLRGKLPAERLLWSLSDNTITRSWRNSNRIAEWLTLAAELYDEVEDTIETAETRAFYLRTLIEAVYIPLKEYDKAEATATRLIELLNRYRDQLVPARWLLVDVYANLAQIYTEMGNRDHEQMAISAGLQLLTEYEQLVIELAREKDSRIEDHKRYYNYALHDFGCECLWRGYYSDAVPLLEKALALIDEPHTHFFLAGAILKATGDRRRSLEHFRKAIENPAFSRRHDLYQAFKEDRSFEDVWNDKRFLAALDKEIQKLPEQVQK